MDFRGVILAAALAAFPAGASWPFTPPPPPLAVEEAFAFALSEEPDALVMTWDVAPGYYLYRDRFAVTAGGREAEFEVGKGEEKDDPWFGTVEVIHGQAVVKVPSPGRHLRVTWQGCQEDGICYMPETREIDTVDMTVREIHP